MLTNFLKGFSKGQQPTQTPAGASPLAPDLARFAVPDGFGYTPPITLPTHYAEMQARGDPDFANKLNEALEPFRTQFATPYAQGAPFYELAQSTVLFPLMEWNWQTRRYIVEQCHLAWERNPDAKQAVRLTKLFSVQNGMMRSYRNKKVEEIIEAFCAHPYNPINEYEKSFVDALNTDGELFIRYSIGGAPDENGNPTGEPGEVVITPLRPWYIQWIQANPKNFREVYSYRYTGSVSDSSGMNFDTFIEDIPPEQIEHITINRLPYEQRGRPELFVILPYLEAHKRWLEDRARQNAFRGAAYHFMLKNGTPAQVAAYQAAFRRPMMAGTVLVTNDNIESKTLEQLVGASDASEDGRQLRIKVATGMGLAEYMFADGQNANLATATAQALPALKTFGEWQDIAVDIWTRIFKRVIQENVKAGMIPEMVEEEHQDGQIVYEEPVEEEPPERPVSVGGMLPSGEPQPAPEPRKASMIKAEDAFDLTYSDLEGLDKMTAVQAILAVMNADLISEKTATGLMPWPLDYDVEKKRIDAEKQQGIKDMLAGKMPMPPGINPATGQPGQPLIPPDDKMGPGMTMPPNDETQQEEQPENA